MPADAEGKVNTRVQSKSVIGVKSKLNHRILIKRIAQKRAFDAVHLRRRFYIQSVPSSDGAISPPSVVSYPLVLLYRTWVVGIRTGFISTKLQCFNVSHGAVALYEMIKE